MDYDYSEEHVPIGHNVLSLLGSLAQEAHDAAEAVRKAEAALQAAQDKFNTLVNRTIPDAMVEAGQQECKTLNGFKLSMKSVLRASIPVSDPAPALKWLRENKHQDVIKQEIKVGFGRGPKAKKEQAALQEFLTKSEIPHTEKEAVHPQTLQKLLKDEIAKGTDVPMKIFGAIVQHFASVEKI